MACCHSHLGSSHKLLLGLHLLKDDVLRSLLLSKKQFLDKVRWGFWFVTMRTQTLSVQLNSSTSSVRLDEGWDLLRFLHLWNLLRHLGNLLHLHHLLLLLRINRHRLLQRNKGLLRHLGLYHCLHDWTFFSWSRGSVWK